SLLMNQIAACFCDDRRCIYSTHILVKGEKENEFSFIMVDDYNGFPTLINNKYQHITDVELEANRERIDNYLNNFRTTFKVFFSQLGNGNISKWDYYKLMIRKYYLFAVKKIKRKIFHPLFDNIELFIYNDDLLSRRVNNIRQ